MVQAAVERIKAYSRHSEYSFMIIVGAVIGLAGGSGAIVFRFLIRFVQSAAYGTHRYTLSIFDTLPWFHVVLVPAVGGLFVGPIVYFVAREAKGHGVPEVMEAVVLKHGVIRKRIVVAKCVASAVSIGTGGSVGREGPIVQIGSAIGSTLGQYLKVSRSKLRTMVGCGAAAGIAATFNAPVAGVLFALEIILGDFGVRRFTPIVISSVMATAVSHHFLGSAPAFNVSGKYSMVNAFELLPYSALGVAAGLVALLFIWMVYASEDFFDRLKVPRLTKPVLGGLAIGIMGLEFPEIFGVGYETIEMALNEELVVGVLLLLVALKVTATSITLGSGASGGIFAPSLMIGAVLGGAMGHIVHGYWPDITASPGAYAVVGMGAVVSATTHAPLTSIMIIFEMTNDYKIILPLMFACIIGNALSSRLSKESIYTKKLARRGVNVSRGRDINVLSSLKAHEILTAKFITIKEDLHLGAILQLVVSEPHAYFYVCDDDRNLKGVVAMDDLRQVILDSGILDPLVIARDVMQEDVPRVTRDDTLDKIMRVFGSTRWEELPVVSGDRLEGVVTRQSVIGAYNREILRRDALSEVVGGIGAVAENGSVLLSPGVVLLEVEAPGWIVGKTLAELDLRKRLGVQVLMITSPSGNGSRSDAVQFVPSPDYTLQLGDNLLVLGPAEAIHTFKG